MSDGYLIICIVVVAVLIGGTIIYVYETIQQPNVSRPAKVVGKRSAVSSSNFGSDESRIETCYYCTFEFANGERMECNVGDGRFADLAEGDRGELETKGSWYIDFRRRSHPPGAAPRLMAFLFTDLVDSTGMKQRLGDAKFVGSVLQPHNALFRNTLTAFASGSERDNAGDGFFVTFESLAEAVEFAVAFQQAIGRFGWEAERPRTRIGIHLGDSMQFEEDRGQHKSAGHAQDLAARLMGLAAGGQILLSRAAYEVAGPFVRKQVAERARGSSEVELTWVGHGPYQLKGCDEPVEVYEVGAAGTAPLRPPDDSEKAWRVR